jgi:APA family basic amino acid/polyamine antiporter
MASSGDLPRWLAAVHPRNRVPHHADLALGALVLVVVLVADLRGAIGFSSFTVLTYYAVANVACCTLSRADRRWPVGLAAGGIVGCALLAVALPLSSVLLGAGVVVAGAVVWALRRGR